MQEVEKYVLKGMVAELQESLKEGNLDEFKKIHLKITKQIGGDTEISDNNANKVQLVETITEPVGDANTEAFIEYLKTDNQTELMKIYEKGSWYNHYDMTIVFERIRTIKSLNPSLMHILGMFCGGHFPKTSTNFYLKSADTHPYSGYNLYIRDCTGQAVEHLIKSAELGLTKAEVQLGDYYNCKGDCKNAIKYYRRAHEKGDRNATSYLFSKANVKYMLENGCIDLDKACS